MTLASRPERTEGEVRADPADPGSVYPDPADPNLVQGDLSGFGLLRPFNRAGVLAAADVHTAVRLARLAGETDQEVVLAAALAVRAPRVGHVSVDLARIRTSAVDVDDHVDLEGLPWPEPGEWLARAAASPLVSAPDGGEPARPLVLAGPALYLESYWCDEQTVSDEILARTSAPPAPRSTTSAAGAGPVAVGPVAVGPASASTAAASGRGAASEGGAGLDERLERLFPGAGSSDQVEAARLAMNGRFTVIAGGPGTGKTTTVARLLAVLFEEAEAAGVRAPLVGLAAPTGKAAARMEEAVRAEAARMDTTTFIRTRLEEVRGSTLHRLLGTRFDRPGRFRHHRGHKLPHDVVVVDEASMVSLSLMARLTEALRDDARLVLVGDPEQLVSVEAGAVLADIVGPPGRQAPSGPEASGVARSIALLRRNHRFRGSLAGLAEAVRAGDSDRTLAVLSGGDPSISWVEADPAGLLEGGTGSSHQGLSALREETTAWAASIRRDALEGDAAGALDALRRHRLLCAHRRGPAGVAAWNRVVEGWVLGEVRPSADEGYWYPGRPVLVTANDYALRLFNGDTGVAVAGDQTTQAPGRLVAAFDEGRDRPPRMVSPTRLNVVETVFAMTVHKSQGSEFDRVTLLLPAATSRLLTRELLYTAITRAREGVTVVATGEALRLAVERPIARASGLGARLWGTPTGAVPTGSS